MNNGITFSGGGDKGAFSVGVVKGLLEKGKSYNMFSGTSTGALICPLLAAGKLDVLQHVYTNVGYENIFSGGSFTSSAINVMFKNSIYEVDNLKKLIYKYYDQEVFNILYNSEILVVVCTVCMENGVITYFTNKDIPGTSEYRVIRWNDVNEMRDSIFASCCQPVLMPPVDIDGFNYVDGGVKEFTPIDILIKSGADSIDIIVTTPDTDSGTDFLATNGIKNTLLTTLNILTNDVSYNDLKIARLYNRGVHFVEDVKTRVLQQTGIDPEILNGILYSSKNPFWDKRELELNIFRPGHYLGSGLTFSTYQMNEMFNYGYNLIMS